MPGATISESCKYHVIQIRKLEQHESNYNDLLILTFSTPTSSFVDCIQKDQERLSVTAGVLNAIFDVFDISPRFAGFISRQHMPGSDTRFDPSTYKPRQHGRFQSGLDTFFHQTTSPNSRERDLVLRRDTIAFDPRRRNSPRLFSKGGGLETLLPVVKIRPVHQEVTCTRARMATSNEGQFPILIPRKTWFIVTAASNGPSCILCSTSFTIFV